MNTASIVRSFPDSTWDDKGPTAGVELLIEDGLVLAFPRLAFAMSESELRFLDARWADGRAKNISLRWPMGKLRGAQGKAADLADLQGLMTRFAEHSNAFVLRLFPHYRGHLQRGNTSFRPVDVAAREMSWRKDDARLHVDAFPSNPMRGARLLRVFCNLNPRGEPRRWRVGEPFEALAKRYVAEFRWPIAGSALLMQLLGITKRRRTEYDHLMLQLHDKAKADAPFQSHSAQAEVDFSAQSTWVVFSDQVLHAVTSGQHLIEQTFYLEPERQLGPQTSPLAVLERMTGRRLR